MTTRGTTDNRLLSRDMQTRGERAHAWEPQQDAPSALPGQPVSRWVSEATTHVHDALFRAGLTMNHLDILAMARRLVSEATIWCAFNPPGTVATILLDGARRLMRLAYAKHGERLVAAVATDTLHATHTTLDDYADFDDPPGRYRGEIRDLLGVLWRSRRTYAHRQSASRAAGKTARNWIARYTIKH